MKSAFLTSLQVESLTDSRWRVISLLRYQSKIYDAVITVPIGFVTDLASVPRVPFMYTVFGNRCHAEATLHDFLYQTYLVRKHKADLIFLEAMKVRKKPFWMRECMYLAVKYGGGSSYESGPDRYRILNSK